MDPDSETERREVPSWMFSLKRLLNMNGFVAGLLGAIVGGGFALWGVNLQIHAASEQAHVTFINEKRIDAYSSWLNAITELSVKEEAAFDALDASLGGGPAATSEIVAVREQMRRMKSIEVRISIVGSKAVSAESQKMIDGHQELVGRLEKLRRDPSLAPTLDVPPETSGATTAEERQRLREASERSVRAIRRLAGEQREESPTFDVPDLTNEQKRTFEETLRITAAQASLSRAFSVASLQDVAVRYDEFVDAAQDDLQIEP